MSCCVLCFRLFLLLPVERQLLAIMLCASLEYAKSSHKDQQRESQDQRDDTHQDACFCHVFLFDKACGIGDGIRRGGDGQTHGGRGSNSDADKDGGVATDHIELVAHAFADDGQDRDEQSGCSRVADEVRKKVTHKSGNNQNDDRTPFSEWDSLDS